MSNFILTVQTGEGEGEGTTEHEMQCRREMNGELGEIDSMQGREEAGGEGHTKSEHTAQKMGSAAVQGAGRLCNQHQMH